MPDRDRIVAAVAAMLGRSAMPREDLAAALVAQGLLTGDLAVVTETLRMELAYDSNFVDVAGGVAWTPGIVDGTSWAVHVDPDDAAGGFVRTYPDLAPLAWWFLEGDVDLVDADGTKLATIETDGVELDDIEGDVEIVRVPKHVLARLSGRWTSVSASTSTVRWEPIDAPPAVDERQVDALRTGFVRALEVERPKSDTMRYVLHEGAIIEALLLDPDAFVGVGIAPLSELYAAAGLEHRDQVVAEVGFDWGAYDVEVEERRIAFLYGLDDVQVAQMTALLDAVNAYIADPETRIDMDAVVIALNDVDVAESFWDLARDRDIDLGEVAEMVVEIMEHEADVRFSGAAWLLARCLDWSGATETAEQLLASVISLGSTHELVLEAAAGLAADRGHAAVAYELLLRAGVGPGERIDRGDHHGHAGQTDDPDDVDDPTPGEMLYREVAPWATTRPPQTAKRNDPCPCGSGRKYKVCHLGSEEFSLADRSQWLYSKATRFLRDRGADVATDVAMVAASGEEALFHELLESELVTDLALHEEAVFTEFLEARSAMLPADEALLAASWALVDRGVFEIVRFVGDRLELRDLGNDAVITVVNVTPNAQTQPGSILVGRPLPIGDVYRAMSGFLAISPSWVAPFLEAFEAFEGGDQDAITATYAKLFSPPD